MINWEKVIMLGGPFLAAIIGALSLWAVGGQFKPDLNGQVVLLIGGAILGGGGGFLFFGTFGPLFLNVLSGDIRSTLIICLSLISAGVVALQIWEGSGGNWAISILGAFAGLIGSLIVIGSIIQVINRFKT
jgi:hypothetical protein